MSTSPTDKFLRACARVCPDEAQLAHVRDTVSEVNDWDALIDSAERHGLAPLVSANARSAGVDLPPPAEAALRALQARHRLAMEIRRRSLIEVLDALALRNIDTLVLKGAALAHMVYPCPGMRPMRDLDLLVREEQAGAAQAVLRDIGFTAPREHHGAMRDHHHLPCATRTREGLMVSIEIHVDAMSGDSPGHIRVDTLANPPREFALATTRARTLGHVDMLRHLCHHTFEPAAETRLISVVDIYTYADSYAAEIPWLELTDEHPFVLNALRCLHYLLPLPKSLVEIVGAPTAPVPNGVGTGMRPLTTILGDGGGPIGRCRELLCPPRWWLHVVYTVPPAASLFIVHGLRHPARLLYWLFRRTRAALRR